MKKQYINNNSHVQATKNCNAMLKNADECDWPNTTWTHIQWLAQLLTADSSKDKWLTIISPLTSHNYQCWQYTGICTSLKDLHTHTHTHTPSVDVQMITNKARPQWAFISPAKEGKGKEEEWAHHSLASMKNTTITFLIWYHFLTTKENVDMLRM